MSEPIAVAIELRNVGHKLWVAWCCRLRLASGTGADKLVVASASSPAAPAVSFLDAAAFTVAAAAL